MVRRIFLYCVWAVLLLNIYISSFYPSIWWSMVIFGPLIVVGFADMLQRERAIRRNFPIIGNFRFLMESVRPEINQYFVESNSSGRPFSREERSVVYQRAKNVQDTLPFGTQKDLYEVGYEWVNHSATPIKVDPDTMRTQIGGPDCKHKYSASLLNISGMSFGSISKNAVLALNGGAKMGNFAHNTGEGGITEHHLKEGGDLIWQIGTGYFGCRTPAGEFDPKKFEEKAQIPEVKMIEIKISQGAKPGGGGIVPAVKVSPEIAEIRGVPLGEDIVSPLAHSAFSTPIEMMEFIGKLRQLSGGKPIGFKLCIGKRHEFLAMCKAMVKTGIAPDFITVDGSEGGTGAAPLEFSNHLGYPLTEGLIYVQNALVGFSLRDKVKIIASGRITTGFGMIHRMCLGADALYSARAMMMALGCIQAVKCNKNVCPVGIATQDPGLVLGLVVKEKNKRIYYYHKNTIKSLAQMLGSMGINHPSDLQPYHLMRRLDDTNVQHYDRIYDFLEGGELLNDSNVPPYYYEAMNAASVETFKRKTSV